MDRDLFDELTESSAGNANRRGILRMAIGGLGISALVTTIGVVGGTGKERRSKKKRGRQEAKPDMAFGTEGAAVGRFVRCALAQVGKPYVWASAGPDTFDCSGLVAYCYQAATGQVITRSSHAQFELGSMVPANRGHLEPGDLVFYDTEGDGAGHVGIVVGPNRTVHALNPAMGVREIDIHWPDIGGPYLGARRLDFLEAGFQDASADQAFRLSGRADRKRTQERRKRKNGKSAARERRQERESADQLEAQADGLPESDTTDGEAQAFYDSPGYECMNDPFLLVRDHDGMGCAQWKPAPAPAPETDQDPLDG